MSGYQYDLFGWYIGIGTGKRTTDIAPTNTSVDDTEGQPRSNWTGYEWVEIPYCAALVDGSVDLSVVKAQKLREILAASDSAFDAMAASYSIGERISWPKQEAEAKALIDNLDAPAPLLRGIAAHRGVSIEELRDKVLTKVTAYEQACALILGRQQCYEDIVRTAETVAEVDAVHVEYVAAVP